jgi:carbon-monoxide dehydrogenase small subunit
MQGSRAEGEVNVKLGPIVSAFQGVLDVKRDDGQFRGVVRGSGRDVKGPSSARAVITYAIQSTAASASQVDVSVKFLLSGALAQFSRAGLVKDVADHLTHIFAQNLEARLSGRPVAAEAAQTLDAAAIARSALWSRITGFFRRLWNG